LFALSPATQVYLHRMIPFQVVVQTGHRQVCCKQLQSTSLTRRQVQGIKHPIRKCPLKKGMQHACLGLMRLLTLITVSTLTAQSCTHQSPYGITFHCGKGPLPCHTICTSREGITEAVLISFLCDLFLMLTCMCRCL